MHVKNMRQFVVVDAKNSKAKISPQNVSCICPPCLKVDFQECWFLHHTEVNDRKWFTAEIEMVQK